MMVFTEKRKRPPAPEKDAIVEANRDVWRGLLFERGPEHECWACGGGHMSLEKAHIIAHRNGGDGRDPSNFFLLCRICHSEQPDDLPLEQQVYWLRNHETSFERAWRKTQPYTAAICAGLITIDESVALILAGLPAPKAA